MDEVLIKLSEWVELDGKAILATVIEQKGSAPRTVGAKMAIRSNLEFSGSVSGGCVEGDVIQLAENILSNEKPVIVDYGITDEQAWSVGLACGGQIKVLVQPVIKDAQSGMGVELLQLLDTKQQTGKRFCLVTALTNQMVGEVCLVSDGKQIFPEKVYASWITQDLLSRITEGEGLAESGIITVKEDQYFIEWIIPQQRLVVIGGVHITIPLVTMAKLLGFFTIVIDPRKIFANPERFKVVDRLITKWPDEGFNEIALNENDFLVVLSHDDKLDLPALAIGLKSNCRYIGMLSSRKTRDRRFRELNLEGFSDEDLKKIYSPVGLQIGSSTPEEIALSIMAEITAIKHGKIMSQ